MNVLVQNHVPAGRRHFEDFGWLRTRWLFSFSGWVDPESMHWGALRVFNDDVVEAGRGFGVHPHAEMEIVSMVLSGEMVHEDSMGNRGVIRAGDVQRMSAGTGLRHGERNEGSESLHFYQIWILPGVANLEPSYAQRHFDAASWRNRLHPVASGWDHDGAVPLNTDAVISRCALDPGRSVKHGATAARRLFLYLASGRVRVGETELAAGDQLRYAVEGDYEIRSDEGGEFVLVDVPLIPSPPVRKIREN